MSLEIKTLPSRIDTVRVYARGATVLRRVVLDVVGGRADAEIEIPELPLALFDPSVRLRAIQIEGSGDVFVSDVRIGLFAPRAAAPEKPPELARIQALERTIAELSDKVAGLRLEIGFIEGIAVLPRPSSKKGLPPPPSPMSARVALEDFISASTQGRRAEIHQLEGQVREQSELLRELQDQLARSSNQARVLADRLTKKVVARLRQNDKAVTRVVFELEYFVPGARWAPAYQCRVARQGGTADLNMRALVVQRTGEDWKGVKLSLSTAMPLRYSELPELSEIRIGRAQPAAKAKRGFRPPPAGARTLFADFDRDRAMASGLVPARAAWSLPSRFLSPLPVLGAGDFLLNLGGGGEGGGPDGYASDVSVLSRSEERPMQVPASPPAPSMAMMVGRGGYAAKAAAPMMEVSDDMDEEAAREITSEVARSRRAPAPAKKKAMSRAKDSKRDSAPEADEDGSGFEDAPDAAVPLIYTSLYLPGPEDGARTRLRALDRREAYAASLVARAIAVEGDFMGAVAAASARAETSFELPRDTIDVRSVAGYFDFVYLADAEVDVPSDGTFHSIPLGTRHAKAELKYVVVPREEPHVYRTAHVTNPTDGPLLPGPVEVYVGGEFVLTTVLPTVAAKGEFLLGLGVEQAIKCARNTRFEEKRSGSKVVATNDLWHTLEIELVNHLDKSAECEVRERIPQPDVDAEVVVEEGEVRPPWEAYTQEELGAPLRGGRRWKVVVPPGRSLKLEAKYAVKIYANNEIVGGNRRES